MVLIDEIRLLQDKIELYMSYIEVLKIKIYYEDNRVFDSEYEKNENELSLIKTRIKCCKMLETLSYLNSEMQNLIDYYIEVSKKEDDE